jgi:hypothetical protein
VVLILLSSASDTVNRRSRANCSACWRMARGAEAAIQPE